MSITLTSRYDSNIPLEVDGILPSRFKGKSIREIGSLPIWRGRKRHRLDDCFEICLEPCEQNLPQAVTWKGNLQAVDRIGERLETGLISIEGNTGNFVGSMMSGGHIEVLGNVAEFAGLAATGGMLQIDGNTGDHLGGALPGAKLGMNRGNIVVSGNIGGGAGEAMRRGMIVCGGQTGPLCGWRMNAGTIISFGGLGKHAGCAMKRGTIIDASKNGPIPSKNFLPNFRPGGTLRFPHLNLTEQWLSQQTKPRTFFASLPLSRLRDCFRLYHGDPLAAGKGEVLVWDVGNR